MSFADTSRTLVTSRLRPRPSCGDAMVQTPFEDCDDGENDGGYRECGSTCHYGERCGDSAIRAAFAECDDGAANGSTQCRRDCTIGPVR